MPLPSVPTGWRFYSLDRAAIYVYLVPPGSDTAAPLPLPGLQPEYRRELAGLVRDDPVPVEIVAALLRLLPRWETT